MPCQGVSWEEALTLTFSHKRSAGMNELPSTMTIANLAETITVKR
jgi:hypothetical protein